MCSCCLIIYPKYIVLHCVNMSVCSTVDGHLGCCQFFLLGGWHYRQCYYEYSCTCLLVHGSSRVEMLGHRVGITVILSTNTNCSSKRYTSVPTGPQPCHAWDYQTLKGLPIMGVG